MRKLLMVMLGLVLVLSGCSGNGDVSSTEDEIVEETKEPVSYSEPIYVVTTADSGINEVSELSGKTLAVQVAYDKEASEYVVECLNNEGISDINYYEMNFYQDLPDVINDGTIDAWIISKGCHELNYDYRHDYDVDSYKIIGEYRIPYYEAKEVDPNVVKNGLLNKPFAIMITGIDERVDPSNYKAARNDVNVLMVVDPVEKHVLTISFPRDSYIKNVCTGATDKLTHFGINGTECVKDSIGELLDIEIDYFVQASFSSFVDIINTLGGVEVDVPLDMCMDQDSYRNVKQPYCLEKGERQLLYGEWALALARNRKYDGIYNGDYGRIRNQALIINGIMDRIAQNPFILLWAGIDWKMDSLVYHNFDVKADDIAALFNLAYAFYDGYSVDNYFVDNIGDTTESGMSIGRIPEYALETAKLKAKYVLTGEIDKDSPYYEDAMIGYVTLGAGNYEDKYMGNSYCLSDDCTIEEGE